MNSMRANKESSAKGKRPQFQSRTKKKKKRKAAVQSFAARLFFVVVDYRTWHEIIIFQFFFFTIRTKQRGAPSKIRCEASELRQVRGDVF